MWRSLWIMVFCWLGAEVAPAEVTYQDIDQPPHSYWQRPLKDRFTALKAQLESRRVALDVSSEKAFLLSLLNALQIPASSQMMVFSTTSLQLSLISPRNPRALYFNEDVYLGYIPGGKIEIVSIDPELGGIFYIFDIPKDTTPPRPERSTRCMNCHAGDDTGHVPGLVVKSVVPGPRGGSLQSFRIEQTGHQIPLTNRFGGWYLTGLPGFTNHWGNIVGQMNAGVLTKNLVEPGTQFSFARYAVPTSDVLPQLLHEHQAGFVNRAVQAAYRTRTHYYHDRGKLPPEHLSELDQQAALLTRYLLFADEAPLPPGGVKGDAAFRQDFLRNRHMTAGGASLKDFDLSTRLFKHRCSYMIYSATFQGLPPAMKQRVYQRLGAALSVEKPDAEYAYLPAEEKQTIRAILKGTLKDLPSGW